MILYNGKTYGTELQDELLRSLRDDIGKTIASGIRPPLDDVILACDTLAQRVMNGSYDDILIPFLKEFNVSNEYFAELCYMFTREGLTYKVQTELPEITEIKTAHFTRRRCPLGVLMHIAAGNFDVLPAYSVVEGLLAGNINILKLPMGDSGLSVRLLSDMIGICPSLAPFIYVFDVPSTETESIKYLADLSDGVAVWGGDVAVSAARKLASVNTKIIAWGHKLSFAYCESDCSDDDLRALADSICLTDQTLCSSCQGLFLDTDSDKELDSFSERFFEILKEANDRSRPVNYGMRAKNAINLYNEDLEIDRTGSTIRKSNGMSVITRRDSELELSYMYRNVWVKKLPLSSLHELHKHKGYLQTASVLTSDPVKRKIICDKLAGIGVVRITSAGKMSRSVPGEAHDGTYALREYTRIVECEFD
ncbi:MAG: acyl-CoA reductase [Clostridiales bacterium]|nr:acyl-CoA reductase [Clostridiales bacterium]